MSVYVGVVYPFHNEEKNIFFLVDDIQPQITYF